MNKLGILCALRSEARCFTSGELPAQQPVAINGKTVLVVSGMGRERAYEAARKLVQAGADCLAGFGSAGALSPALRPGDLVVAAEVLEAGRTFTASAGLAASVRERLSRNNITVYVGLLACAAEPVAAVEDKQEMFARTGAMAADMESAGVFDTAQRLGLAALSLRVIIDDAGMTLPDAALRRVDEFGEVDVRGLALDLARSPGQIPALMRLACAARRAGRTMRQAAELLLHHPPLRHSGLVPESSQLNRRPEGDSS